MTADYTLVDEAGVLLLAADGSIEMSDAAGERWLAQLGTGRAGAGVPQVLAAVACRARRAIGSLARVGAPSGVWLVIRASILRGDGDGDARTALTIEPARADDLASVIGGRRTQMAQVGSDGTTGVRFDEPTALPVDTTVMVRTGPASEPIDGASCCHTHPSEV